ncbi:MAG: hypothetical protein PVJ89_02665 [Planctomycetota bacterium]|jgi:hypothetical protein
MGGPPLTRRPLGALALLALVGAALAPRAGQGPEDRARMGPVQRLLGPIASAAASVEWARYMGALDRGDTPMAYAHAARALSLDSRAAAGWLTLADHFVFIRASPLEEPDAAARRRWIQEGLAVLRSGERRCAAPGALARYAAILRSAYLSELPEDRLPWPGGARALLEEAREDLDRAAALGADDLEAPLAFIEAREAELDAEGR